MPYKRRSQFSGHFLSLHFGAIRAKLDFFNTHGMLRQPSIQPIDQLSDLIDSSLHLGSFRPGHSHGGRPADSVALVLEQLLDSVREVSRATGAEFLIIRLHDASPLCDGVTLTIIARTNLSL